MFTKRNITIIDLIGVLIALVAANPNLDYSELLDSFSDRTQASFGDADFTIISGSQCAVELSDCIPDSEYTPKVEQVIEALTKEDWVNLES